MVKLLKNEWKRYKLFSIIILIAATGLVCLLLLSAWSLPLYEESHDLKEFTGYGSMIMLCILLTALPYAGAVYCILSYITDIGRKGMIFLTPVSTWKIILSKLIYGLGFCAALSLIGSTGMLLASWICQINGEKGVMNDVIDILTLNLRSMFLSLFGEEEENSMALYIAAAFVKHFMTVMHTSLIIMASISLARFSANSTGVQVLLSIVYYYVISMIEKLLLAITIFLFTNDDDSFYHSVLSVYGQGSIAFIIISNAVFSAALYAICTSLTDRKVNLVS